MKLDIKKIEKKLNTSFLCQNIIYYENIDSTQDIAKTSIKKEDIINGTYIVTDKQTKGKGTQDKKWYGGEYENICGTFVLTPNCNINKLNNLTIIIAKCLIKAIKNLYNIELQIKHPNDIMCNSKKLAGILTESITQKEIVKYLFIGIGININQTIFNHEIGHIATSLKKEYKREFDRENIISEFSNIFEKEYLKIIE